MKSKKARKRLLELIILISLIVIPIYMNQKSYAFDGNESGDKEARTNEVSYFMDNLPEYSGSPYVVINDNNPDFEDNLKNDKSFEEYSDLDSLGRCGAALANISVDLMPTSEREMIGKVKPSGWHTVRYDDLIEDKYLYNRCHLIGFQLTGENANPKNLITCTRQMNTTGMLSFENKVANYIRKTNNHVLYRVTPMFKNNDLVATGAQMEAYSIEDKGKGINFNVFVYNVQDGITINYENGDSERSD